MKRIIGNCVAIVILAAGPAATPGQAPVGVVRLTPELTITDDAFGGKDFFGSVNSLAVDDAGAVYVCDAKSKNIKKFDSAGRFVKIIGRPGQGPGEFNYPYETEIFRDRLYVRDLFAYRVSIFDLEGNFISSIPIDRARGSWRDFRALPDGRWIVETEFIDRSGPNEPQEMRLSIHRPDFGFIKTLYRKAVLRNKYISEPVRTNVPIPFYAEAEWGLTPEGKIVVGFSGDYGIEILDPDKGKILAWTHRYEPVAVTKRDRDEYFAGLTGGVVTSSGQMTTTQGAPDYVVNNTTFPKNKPAFERFAVDGDGRIWTFLWLASPGAKRMIDLFDSKGNFLGRGGLEGADRLTYIYLFRPGFVWMAVTDDDGLSRVVKYRISS